MHPLIPMILHLVTVALLIFGVFFMSVGAFGLVRMPDVYHRMHAATKGVTLGIAGMLAAAAVALSTHEQESPFRLVTIVVLVILFQFVANPVGAHMLAKAAHMDRCPKWTGTLADELEEESD